MTLHTNCKLMAVKIYCRQFIELSMGGCCSHPSIWVKKSYIQLNECVGGGGGGGWGIFKWTNPFLLFSLLSWLLGTNYYPSFSSFSILHRRGGDWVKWCTKWQSLCQNVEFSEENSLYIFSTLCWRDIFGARIIQRTCIRCKTIC